MSAPGRPDVDGLALLARLPTGARPSQGAVHDYVNSSPRSWNPASGLIGHLATLTPNQVR
jgi:hypothetical protein